MNNIQAIINTFALGVSLSTAGSILIHDTNVDKAMLSAMSAKSSTNSAVVRAPGNDPHTHSERGSLHQAIRDLNASQPRVQPRNQSEKKYIQHKSTRGHHPFGDVMLPMVY